MRRYPIFCQLAVLFISVSQSVTAHDRQHLSLFQETVRSNGNPPAQAAADSVRLVKINERALERARVFVDLPDQPTDKRIQIVRKRLVEDDSGKKVWIGSVLGEPFSQVVLTMWRGTFAGAITTQSGHYEIEQTDHGQPVIFKVDETTVPPPAAPVPAGENGSVEGEPDSAPPTATEEATIQDLLVVYTPGSRVRYGEAGIQAKIITAVAQANQAYVNSAVNIQLNIVHMAETAYIESGNVGTSLSDLQSNGDGKMDEVHVLRNIHGADLVALITEDSSGGGVGYLMQSVSSSFSPYAFSVTHSPSLTNYVLAHEIGHNQGNMHDRESSSYGGAYPYSYGFRRCETDGTGFRTIMSYACLGAIRVPHFSNPNIAYNGFATGVNDSADNARSMNNTAATVAAFRDSASTTPPAVPSSLAAVSQSANAIALTWTDNSGDETGFRVEQRPYGSAVWSEIATLGANTTAFIDNGLLAGSTYQYRVRAYNGAGNSAHSNEASATTAEAPPIFDQYAASDSTVYGEVVGTYLHTRADDGAVQSIQEIESSGKPNNRRSFLEHIWTFNLQPGAAHTLFANAHGSPSTDGDTFDFDCSTDNGSSWSLLFTVASTEASNVQNAVMPGANGTLLVRVRDRDRTRGNHDLDTVFVDQLYVHTELNAGPPPAAPGNLTASASAPSQVVLTWSDHASNEIGHEIERRTGGAAWQAVGTTSENITTFDDNSVSGGQAYEYRVRAVNGTGYSDYSNIASATTPQGTAIVLSASKSKVKGIVVAALSWSGATGGGVDILRNSILVATVPNSGSYIDETGLNGDPSLAYRVCEAGTNNCSNTVIFGAAASPSGSSDGGGGDASGSGGGSADAVPLADGVGGNTRALDAEEHGHDHPTQNDLHENVAYSDSTILRVEKGLPFPELIDATGLLTTIVLSVGTEPGSSYRFEYLGDDETWQPFGGWFKGDGIEKSLRVPIGTQQQCTLYRVRVTTDDNLTP